MVEKSDEKGCGKLNKMLKKRTVKHKIKMN